MVQNFTLIVRIPSEQFEQSVNLFTIEKQYSVLIQTDKPTYKPGDTVRFRILVIDSDKKPYAVKRLKVELIDTFDNVVSKYEEKKIEKLKIGVISGEFSIVTEPIMGMWQIRISSFDSNNVLVTTEQKFEIKE